VCIALKEWERLGEKMPSNTKLVQYFWQKSSNNHLDRQSRNHEKLGGSFREIDISISS